MSSISLWYHAAFLDFLGRPWLALRGGREDVQNMRAGPRETPLNRNGAPEHQTTVCGDMPLSETSYWRGFRMKCSAFDLLGSAFKISAVAAVLVLSTSAGHAQSRPFAGFDGAWSGNGTVSLSDGSSERLRCRAEYKVDTSGLGLKQTLRCASDSYKFDLISDVKSQGERVSGQWNETTRNIFGSLQGTAGGGKIDVMVEAPGFTASLALRTSGNKQTVQISSKGEIRGVSITMVKS
jgi:hypothetical protein